MKKKRFDLPDPVTNPLDRINPTVGRARSFDPWNIS
jgi:hypothetical protein